MVLFSAVNRFVLAEPLIILISKGAPVLFASAFCANCLGETITNGLGLLLSAIVHHDQVVEGLTLSRRYLCCRITYAHLLHGRGTVVLSVKGRAHSSGRVASGRTLYWLDLKRI